MTDNINKPEPLDLDHVKSILGVVQKYDGRTVLLPTAQAAALIDEVERLRSNQSHLEEIAGDSRDRNARLKAALERHGLLGEVEND